MNTTVKCLYFYLYLFWNAYLIYLFLSSIFIHQFIFLFNREELEAQHTALVSLLSQTLNQSQHLLEKNEQTVSETQALHSLDSLCKQVAVLIAMKKVPLHKALPNDLCSLKEFRSINTMTKSLEGEIDREISRLNV